MNINITEISKEEMRSILKALPVEKLRLPLIEDNKLAKRYISGFRVNNVTYTQLVPLYYQETHNRNTDVERALKSELYSYIKECNLEDKLELLSEDISWKECIGFGMALGDSGCEIGIDILLKVAEKKISDEKKQLIGALHEQQLKYRSENDSIVAKYEKEAADADNLIEKLKKEISNSSAKKEKADELRKKAESSLGEKCEEISRLKEQIQELALSKDEIELEMNNVKKGLEQAESTIDDLNQLIIKKDESIRSLNNDCQKINEQNTKLQKEKQLIYDEAIARLVKDTIEDLKEEYDVDLEGYAKTIENADSGKGILAVWEQISKNNAAIVEDIENSMRNNVLDMGIIDQCNDVENSVLIKYVIVKAIKSLYFEFMSAAEKEKKMFSELRK